MIRAAAALSLALLLLAGCDAPPSGSTQVTATRVRTEFRAAVPPGSVPRGTAEAMRQLASPEPAITNKLLVAGRERYDAFCSPCHGLTGYGDGVVVQRGFPAPPSFHTEQQRTLSRSRIVGVITNGIGVMFPFAERVPPQERWAIASYVKALQLSQSAPLDRLPEDLRRQVEQ